MPLVVERLTDQAFYWFVLYQHAVAVNDADEAREAAIQLRRLGFQVQVEPTQAL